METTLEHYNMWGATVAWIVLYSLILFFLPFYKKVEENQKQLMLLLLLLLP